MRYTEYSDQEREDLLWYFFNRILPDEKDTKELSSNGLLEITNRIRMQATRLLQNIYLLVH